MQPQTVTFQVLSQDDKQRLVKELWDYHDATVQGELAFYYSEKFNIGIRSFKEQLSGRRSMKGSQLQFCIDFMTHQDRTSEKGLRDIFRTLFEAEPETYGYTFVKAQPLPFDAQGQMSDFDKFKYGIGKIVNERKEALNA